MASSRYGEIVGMKEAREALQELDKRVQLRVGKQVLRAPASVFVAAIKARAPVSSSPYDPTPGSLRDSVHVGKASQRAGQARLEILADDIASVPNEYGTSKMAPQPFFRPAVNASRAEAAAACAAAVKIEVDAAAAAAASKGLKG